MVQYTTTHSTSYIQHVLICMQAHISKFLIVGGNPTSARGSRTSSWAHVGVHGLQQPRAASSNANLVEMFRPCTRRILVVACHDTNEVGSSQLVKACRLHGS